MPNHNIMYSSWYLYILSVICLLLLITNGYATPTQEPTQIVVVTELYSTVQTTANVSENTNLKTIDSVTTPVNVETNEPVTSPESEDEATSSNIETSTEMVDGTSDTTPVPSVTGASSEEVSTVEVVEDNRSTEAPTVEQQPTAASVTELPTTKDATEQIVTEPDIATDSASDELTTVKELPSQGGVTLSVVTQEVTDIPAATTVPSVVTEAQEILTTSSPEGTPKSTTDFVTVTDSAEEIVVDRTATSFIGTTIATPVADQTGSGTTNIMLTTSVPEVTDSVDITADATDADVVATSEPFTVTDSVDESVTSFIGITSGPDVILSTVVSVTTGSVDELDAGMTTQGTMTNAAEQTESAGTTISPVDLSTDLSVTSEPDVVTSSETVDVVTSEPDDVSVTSEPVDVGVTSEPDDVSVTSETVDVVTSEPDDVSVTSEPDDVSVTSEPDDVSVTSEPDDVSVTSEPDDVSVTSEPDDISVTSEPDVSVALTSEPDDVSITSEPVDSTTSYDQEDGETTAAEEPVVSTVSPDSLTTIVRETDAPATIPPISSVTTPRGATDVAEEGTTKSVQETTKPIQTTATKAAPSIDANSLNEEDKAGSVVNTEILSMKKEDWAEKDLQFREYVASIANEARTRRRRQATEAPTNVKAEDVKYVAPTPRQKGDDLEIQFVVSSGSTYVPAATVINGLDKDHMKETIGVELGTISPGIPQVEKEDPVEKKDPQETTSSDDDNRSALFVAIIIIAVLSLILLTSGLLFIVYDRRRTRRGEYITDNASEVESGYDNPLMNEKKGTNGNGAHLISIKVDTAMVPMEDANGDKGKFEVEDTHL